MPLGVSYMGTKRVLAGTVAQIVESSPRGPVLDAFAGMCAIGSAVGANRSVWTNDAQFFAWSVAQAHFCSRKLPLDQLTAAALCRSHFQRNVRKLEKRFAGWSEDEASALSSSSQRRLKHVEDIVRDAAVLKAETHQGLVPALVEPIRTICTRATKFLGLFTL